MRVRKANASEPLTTCRKLETMSKPGYGMHSGTRLEETCLLSSRHPALRRREPDPGFNEETQEPVVPMTREKLKQTAFARVRVPMRNTGAGASVVEKKVL